MQIITPSFEILEFTEVGLIELAARKCYKSDLGTTKAERDKFIASRIRDAHESVLEHSMMSVLIICDRGVSHEIVRHRLCAFSQESTRYCNYTKAGITIIHPVQLTQAQCERREEHFRRTQEIYELEISEGQSPQIARGVLPTALKTELVWTANFREWRHIFKLRTSKAAHPQMRELLIPLALEAREKVPVLFEDIRNVIIAAQAAAA